MVNITYRGVAQQWGQFAPSYANLFMGWFETHHILIENNPYKKYIKKYHRYIDDLIIIWEGDNQQLESFVDYCNDNNNNIRFTYKSDQLTMDFLDIQFTIKESCILTDVYRKTLSRNSLLHRHSSHPEPLLRGVPTGQFIRLRRNCTTWDTFHQRSMELWDRLTSRGYETDCVKKAYENAIMKNRTDLLKTTKNNRYKQKDKRIRFITTFSTEAKQIQSIIHKHWSILDADPILSIMDLKKPQIVYRRSPNLRDKVAPSMLPDINKTDNSNWMKVLGTYKCGANICKCCRFINKSDQFQSTNTQKCYKNRMYANCKTMNVIYLATCRCGQQYVGKTTRRLKDRVLEHLACINRRDFSSAIAEHVIDKHQAMEQYVTFQVIEFIKLGKRKGDIEDKLTKREFHWILTLNTAKPKGLNKEGDIKYFIR
ncbi:uncharacterized protein LOC108711328 [Xenopus laevis]|uniref:Uncharacterized protein LOC108711328 n=1 Tax=Xenopus laevis TaxID=8355 RepID=A0A8J0UV99_XENLA|nr:uncharacterized protein LOC108711328 [Xenopus laevis]